MVLNSAASALLSLDGSSANSGSTQRDDATGEKRTKPRRYEHVAPQVLNVGGVSPIHECSNAALWNITKKGNKSAAFYSEFCSDDLYRQGIAGSRHADTMLSFGHVLQEGVWDTIIAKPILQKVRAEFATFKPMLETLNGGKTSEGSGHSHSLFAITQKKAKKDKDAVLSAADGVYGWLTNEDSSIRGFLQIMGWGGVFYSAMCSNKIGRCAMDVKCGGISKDRFRSMMVARLCGDGPTEDDDTAYSITQVSKALLGGA